MNLNGGQDWNPVILRKKPTTSAQATSAQAVNAALRSGARVDTVKKATAANSSGHGGPIKNAVKLENETEDFHHDHVSSELKKQIQQARLAKGLTQAQVAQLVNEKPQVINEYESGKAIPNPQILSKLSRALGVQLKKNPAPAKKAAPRK